MCDGPGKLAVVDGEIVEVQAEPGVRALVAMIERLSAARRTDLSPAEMGEDLRALRHACDLLELEFATRAAEFAATDEYDRQGSTSAVQWIRHECNLSTQAALNAVDVGEQAPVLPQSAAAVREGRIGYAHLALLAGTARALREGDAVATFDETPLLEQAAAHSVSRFRFDCAHTRHMADPRAYLKEQVEMVALRSLDLMPRSDGALILKGFLDAEGGATLRTALEPLARRLGAEDERRRERRLADALIELAAHRLDTGELPQRGGQRPHLQVTASVATLQGEEGAPAGDLELAAAPIAAATVRRLACDAGVTRVLLGPDSAVVDVGRSRRLPSGPTRRALAARDRGCVWPGCERSASWTSAHHLEHWAQGGATDLANLALVCYRHHWLVHEGGWQLVRNDDGVHAIPPAPSHPREADFVPDASYRPRPRAPDGAAALSRG
jgi:Domain of unknown function (DUF222)/HNH endonuclease